MIEIYKYSKQTGVFKGTDKGLSDDVLSDVKEDEGYTLIKPPDLFIPHKWNGLEWVKAETET